MLGRAGNIGVGNGFRLSNPHLTNDELMYHIGISSNDNLEKRFGDVKFICMGGKGQRMRNFAEFLYKYLGKPENSEFEENSHGGEKRLKDLASAAGRYSMFKVGPVISASHGIGSASMSVILHEVLKLTHFAQCRDVTFIRIGTSGGLGLEGGTVVITKQAYNGLLEPCFKQVACGKEIPYDTKVDQEMTEKLQECAEKLNVHAVVGNTLASNDFYEEQGRLDGALCSYTQEEKMSFIQRAHDEFGVRNMEMESACFIATCKRAGVKCAVICVCLVNRLKGDGITTPRHILQSWEEHPQEVAAEFIKHNCFNNASGL